MTRAQQAQLNTVLIGGGLAAAAAFAWTRRAALFPGLAPAPATPAPTSAGYPLAPTPPAPMVPLIAAPVPLPQSYPIAPIVGSQSPNSIVVNSPGGPQVVSVFDPRIQGCRVGPNGGLECPDARGGAVTVSEAQRDPCRAPIDQEVAACQARKPLWSRQQCYERLTAIRQALCAVKAWPYSVANETAMTGHRADYFNLTGVQLL